MKIIAFPELRAFGIGFSRVHLRRLIANGDFPEPVRLSPRRIGWIADEIEAFLARHAAERSGPPSRSTSEADAA